MAVVTIGGEAVTYNSEIVYYGGSSNIFGGRPNVAVAWASGSFIDAGINESNTAIIYEVDSPTKSYVPGRSINGVTAFTRNKGYYIIAKIDMDLSQYPSPPLQ